MEIIIFKIFLVLALFLLSITIAAYSTFSERKVAAFMQDRIGPNRAGPFGLLQPLADGVKMIMKEEILPASSNKLLFILGPAISMVTALMASAVIPWGPDITIAGTKVHLQVADINIGILYIMGVVSIGVYGIMIGGWASNNKFALLGAVRASTQMISYELAMGMSIIAVIMTTGSLSLGNMVTGQSGWHGMAWNVVLQPLGFLIFLICAFAETNRTPFDLPESETELIGGYHTEYSSMKLGFYLFAEYINMFLSSAVISCLYFGGYNFPFMDIVQQNTGEILFAFICFLVLMTKILFFIFFFFWVRWTIPRFRFDQLMNLGWKILLPLSIINMLITGTIILLNQ
ncbi:MAG TPA: NADH-quinone oxidoreductase subunit NuoH [Saprospiraceae bacterium]|jgi:NADH-quinone oxidoreductase subunit H|nr:NADH-quinone oxidoreductase subunit NuoH [Saprospiraceae bacterium]MBK6667407.1 NADH-quinone oxidoreductase subunit NuoH [Saprospiraceae bacterium]MBK7697963.1 NADH-quinone oxidoreductase subunit NuoH [Saprospiraceae bacterium]MBK8825207.1 NADH-quinone oxidoreductase subunit NuoH [Saprospiraceae bacterium]MBK9580872.1 NADH-quinone oxidoreductase subunit NuoH [Saprospiraceae bacterium]